MANKIIIIGPANTGKSTLRKIFFEGESVINLLNNPLEPTYGAESYFYKLSNEIGVIDLAGQEINRWIFFEQEIFRNADIIIVVLDSRAKFSECYNFIQKLIEIRKEKCKKARFYVLFHKIDLLSDTSIEILKENTKKFKKISNCYAYLTSIIEEYYLDTFNVFLEILNIAQERHLIDLPFNLAAIKANAMMFSRLKDDKVVDLRELSNILSIPKSRLQSQMEIYEKGGLIKTKKMGNILAVYLTEKGEIYNSTIIKSFFQIPDEDKEDGEEFISATEENDFEFDFDFSRIGEQDYIKKITSDLIYGFIISDENGRTLLIFESDKNKLENVLNTRQNSNFDIELVPMFISAMHKFSMEINIQGFTGFKLQGTNIRVNSIYRDSLTFTIFSIPEFNPELVREQFSNLFDEFLERFEEKIKLFEKTGNATPFKEFESIAHKELLNIAQNYLKIRKKKASKQKANMESLKSYKEIYQQLDKIDEIIEKNDNITKNEIKKLRMDLLKAILDENIDELDKLMIKVQQLLPYQSIT